MVIFYSKHDSFPSLECFAIYGMFVSHKTTSRNINFNQPILNRYVSGCGPFYLCIVLSLNLSSYYIDPTFQKWLILTYTSRCTCPTCRLRFYSKLPITSCCVDYQQCYDQCRDGRVMSLMRNKCRQTDRQTDGFLALYGRYIHIL